MSHTSQKQLPPGWGDNGLSHFIDTACNNAVASYVQLQQLVARFVEPEEFYRVCMQETWRTNRRTPVSLIVKSWSSYNASIMLAMSGFCSETYTMSRNTIEWGAYSAAMLLNPELIAIWEGRMNSEAERNTCRSTFTHGKIVARIRSLDAGLADRYSAIYETTIDRGAHPNVEGARLTEIEKQISDTETYIEIAALSDDRTSIQKSLETAIDAGILVRDMIMRVFEIWAENDPPQARSGS